MTPEYKQTPVDKIPKDWDIVEIKEVSEFIRGTEPGSKSYNTEGVGYKFLRVSDLSKQILEPVFTNRKKSELIFCDNEDILLTLDGVPGVVNKGFEGAISSGIRIVKPKTSNINKEFLFYFLRHRIVQKVIEKYTTGTTIKHASRAIDHIKILLPPLSEQKRIAEILSTVDQSIQRVDEAVAKTERLKKGLMQKLLTEGIGHEEFQKTKLGNIPKTWKIVKLGDIIDVKSGQYFRYSEFKDSGVRCLKIDNVGYGEISWENVTFLPEEYLEKHSDLVLEKGDIVLALNRPITNERVKVGMIEDDFQSILYQRVGKLILKDENRLDKRYFFYSLVGENFKRQLSRRLVGMDQPYIRTPHLLRIEIPLPPLSEQNKIIKILTNADYRLELEKERKEKLERIKIGLMNDLLTGRRRVKIAM